MTPTEEIVFDNLFVRIRKENFNYKDSFLPMSPWKWRRLERLVVLIKETEEFNPSETYHFSSKTQENKRKCLVDNERHTIDTSIETLHLLNIIVFNIYKLENNEISFKGIIALGQYLRHKGHLVDYVKLEEWIKTLKIKKIVSLISSFLVELLGFEKNEIPFVHTFYSDARKMAYRQLFQNDKTTNNLYRLFKYSKYAYFAHIYKKTSSLLDSIEE